MDFWLQALFAVIAIVGPWVAGYFGIQRGMAVGLAVHAQQIKQLEAEVVLLRQAKHEVAQRVTENTADIYVLKRKAGLG